MLLCSVKVVVVVSVSASVKDRKGFKKDILTNTDQKLISTLTKYNFLFRGLSFSP